ncbi:GNAT family N-acetyltransferase [Companilactobacillus metriopterae]|uniref:GNAT family N-acetyltransferase n=1 Tax=Companilactobacillus metriopterae TaxID=1909267 RepID=UPI00100C0226|nr:GNAT family N-acetyltransferase [Companilactobacillus metriopterae]
MAGIRLATTKDAQQILDIYTPYIENTTITFEYDVPTLEEFAERINDVLENFPYLVYEDKNGSILGYAYAHYYGERAAYNWTVEVSIYLSENASGKGIGTKLYRSLEEELTKQKVINIVACVTEENIGSIRFHEKLGFKNIGTFEKVGYKFNKWLDVVWFEKVINNRSTYIGVIIPYSELQKKTYY